MERKQYDVVVAGGGPAGVAAALEAARSGARTALIERYGCLGGNLTQGLVGPMLGDLCPGTMAAEIEAYIGSCPGRSHDFEEAKWKLAKLLYEAGADVYLQTLPTGVTMESGCITSLTAHGKFGTFLFESKAFVDATGDGDLAALCGCEFEMGREDGLVQPVSHLFTIVGVDPRQELMCYHEAHTTDLGNGKEYLALCRKAWQEGRLPENVNIVRLYPNGCMEERLVNAVQANGVNPLDAADMFRAEVTQRRDIQQVVEFLRAEVPGFKNIRLKATASTMGVRESRRILGDYVLTAEDLLSGRRFADAVVHDADYVLDIHNPSGAGQAEGEDSLPQKTKPYDIPFSAMRPRGVENLITAGRCISGTHTAHASCRVMRICMAMGQAAGAAGAMMAERGCTSRALPVSELRAHLKARGVQL